MARRSASLRSSLMATPAPRHPAPCVTALALPLSECQCKSANAPGARGAARRSTRFRRGAPPTVSGAVTVSRMSARFDRLAGPGPGRYAHDVLAPAPKRELPEAEATPGVVVEEVETGWVGAVVRTEKSGGVHVVVLEDRRGKTRTFPLGPGFWIDGAPVRLVAPRGPALQRPTRT